MTVVVDASVALKWVLQEEDTEQALRLWDIWQATAESVIAPPLFKSEVTNAVHQWVRHGRLDASDASDVVESLMPAVTTREPPELYTKALVLAHELAQGSTYDALYLALSELEGCEMWTADQRFFRAAQPRFPRLRSLRELP